MYNPAQQQFFSIGYVDGLHNRLHLHGTSNKKLADAYTDGHIAGCLMRLNGSFIALWNEMIILERT